MSLLSFQISTKTCCREQKNWFSWRIYQQKNWHHTFNQFKMIHNLRIKVLPPDFCTRTVRISSSLIDAPRIGTSMIKTRVEIELIFIGLITRISTQNRFVYITVQLNIVLQKISVLMRHPVMYILIVKITCVCAKNKSKHFFYNLKFFWDCSWFCKEVLYLYRKAYKISSLNIEINIFFKYILISFFHRL